MTKLSVNINKIATLRNARGGNNPDVIKAAIVSDLAHKASPYIRDRMNATFAIAMLYN
jgi:pyridoxine 5'-phosphate synthase PdxJ